MSILKRIINASALVVAMFWMTAAQDSINSIAQRSSVSITATAFGDRIRITAPASVVGMQVEVYAASGEKVLDLEIKSGNVFDWQLPSGQRLPAGRYVCVVKARSISGRVTQRYGTVNVNDQVLSVEPAEVAQLSALQVQAIGPVEESSSWAVVGGEANQTPTVIAHDGAAGQLTRGRGALTFRVGDFFAGKDTEQMRLTEEGNLGIGTDKPKAKLDVAGTISAREGLMFSDGSTLNVNEKGGLTRTTAGGEVVPNAAGTGTLGKLAKWTETGGAGTLGDSVITEASGRLGIGTANPNFAVTMFGNDIGLQLISPTTGTTAADGFRFGIDSTNRAFLFNQEATDMFFGTSAAERMRITSAGNVGIGTTNPLRHLHVVGPGNQEIGIQSSDTGGRQWTLKSSSGLTTGRFEIVDSTAAVNRFTILSNGNLGVGTTNPAHKLDVSGAINASTEYRVTGARMLHVGGSSVGNTFLGIGAGASISPLSENNSFFGNGAGQSTTIAGGNSFFGADAGRFNLTGGENSFFGNRAGEANTTGDGNSFFGVGAGDSNTTASANSFFGRAAGAGNTTGNNNSFFGFQSGLDSSIARNNSFFGYRSGTENAIGEDNAFFGSEAGRSNRTSRNSFFGRMAGSSTTTGNENTFVGYNAGSNNTTGFNNTAIGANARVGSGDLHFATAIGANTLVTTSNTIALGTAADNTEVRGALTVNGSIFATSSVFIEDLEISSVPAAQVCWNLSSKRLVSCGFLGSPSKQNGETFNSGSDPQLATLEAETKTLKKQLTTLQAENAALRHQNVSMDARLSVLELNMKPKTPPQNQ